MGPSQPPVSVILPTFNRASYIAASLESVLGQTIPPAQVIVVDDGSTDATREVLGPFLDRITLIEQDNAGKPAAINAALPLVEGDYIWVFDDDDIACTDALERHLEVLERRPEVGFTYSGAFYCSSHPDTGWLCVERELRPRPFPEEDFLAELLLESYTASPAVVVRSEVQRRAGPYNTQLGRSQDWEMALRWGLVAPAARLDDERPTYYRRFHPGLRGPKATRFEPHERVRRGRELSRYVLRELARYIELRHYLPYPEWDLSMSESRRRVALVRRLSVRLRWGLWEEAMDDLQRLAEMPVPGHGPTPPEVRFLARSLAKAPIVQELREAKVAGSLGRRLKEPAVRPLRRHVVRGLYYLLLDQLRHREWKDLPTTLDALRQISGVSGAMDILAHGRRGTTGARR